MPYAYFRPTPDARHSPYAVIRVAGLRQNMPDDLRIDLGLSGYMLAICIDPCPKPGRPTQNAIGLCSTPPVADRKFGAEVSKTMAWIEQNV